MSEIKLVKAKKEPKIPMLRGKSGTGYSQDYYFIWGGFIRQKRKTKDVIRLMDEGKSFGEIYKIAEESA